ncbi:gluconate 2-dehydrogenase subunit 3 family protein [Frigidibacter sp. MR17.14]|uniref:gluconate 2-dehydrogenase subunit 3 family protein n=1 Tax=Frigidibacter sp. MR17.14 TaxID=3126509 RepID=UPI003012EC6E
MTDLPGIPSRRNFLKASAATVALVGVAAQAKAKETAAAVPLDEYKPEYLNAVEWAFVMAATARLIPSEGDGPGALEARVPVFIDLQLAGDYGTAEDWYMAGPHDPTVAADRGWQTPLNPAEVYRKAIPLVDDWCRTTHGAIFAELEADKQDATLTALQKGEVTLPPDVTIFFTTLLANTKEGYFADPMYGGNHGMASWVYIGFPGARAAFREWPTRHNIKYPLGPVSIKGERA